MKPETSQRPSDTATTAVVQARTADDAADPQALFAAGNLIAAVRRLSRRLDDATRRLHADDDLTVAERGLLLLLRQGGVQTIPQLAARRGASRQYIQQTLAPLTGRGLVHWLDNPQHRRSRLAALTPAGTELARRLMAREGYMLGQLAATVERSRLLAAAATLTALETALAAAALPGAASGEPIPRSDVGR